NGVFSVAPASPSVREVLELAGLDMLLGRETAATTAAADTGRAHTSASATYEIFSKDTPAGAPAGVQLNLIGSAAALTQAAAPTARPPRMDFGASSFALGIGALGANYADCDARFGEFLAIGGTAAFQPSDGSS